MPSKRPTTNENTHQAKVNSAAFGFKARKRTAAIPVKAVTKPLVKLQAKEEAAEVDVQPTEEAAPLPFHTHAVQVDAFVKRAYRLIDSKSYLVWGLTSDWAVEEREETGTRRSRRTASTSAAAATTSSVTPTADDSRDDASEGYGEMTAGSIQRMLNTLQQLHRHVAPGVLPARTGGRSWELTPAGTFVDIGSGYGKVVVHAGLALRGVKAHGIEYVAMRADVAASALTQLMREATEEAAAGLRNVSLCCGDATVDLGRTIDFSHVYIYDKVFADTTIARLAAILNKSPSVRVLAVYQRPETWFRLGLSERFVEAASLTMNTTGNQSFKCTVFVHV